MATKTPGACGCEEGDPVTSTDALTPSPRVSCAPIACTLDPAEIPARERDLRAAFEHLVSSSVTEAGFRWTFRAGLGVEAKVRQIAHREAVCCAFARFDVVTTPGALTLEVTAPPEARDALEALRALPSELARGDDALARVLAAAALIES